MKSTGKTLTLRGTAVQVDWDNWNTKNILDYANVLDINKAWRVRWVETWLSTPIGLLAPGSRTDFSITTMLDTEQVANPSNRADDNRQIAWGSQTYSLGRAPASKCHGIIGNQVVIDPEHIVQKELNINFLPAGDAVIEGTLIDINFIVYLEEIQITANESIVSTIKQSAQSLNQ
jgi:hypothetical protein|tara:strand:- start:568 stop:1092 length:525 start_codon:yes stop_codon:yes gene_type:complete